MNLLVVEDDEAVRELIVTTLETAGHEVSVAHDGLEALERLRRRRPDGVVLDIHMPRMDGFALLEKMREDLVGEAIPVLMLTARSSPDDIRRAVQLGARDFIGKPFEPRQLLRRISRMALS